MRMWVVKPSFVNFEVLTAAINEIPKTMGRKNHSYYPGNFKGSRGDHCPEEWAARQSERQLKKGLWPLRQVIYYDDCKVGCIIENAEKSAVTHSQLSTGVRSTIDLKKTMSLCPRRRHRLSQLSATRRHLLLPLRFSAAPHAGKLRGVGAK